VHFDTDGSFSLIFISNESIDIKVDETVIGGELVSNFLTKIIAVSPWSDVDGSWFNLSIDFDHGFFGCLLRVDREEICLFL